MFIGRKLTPNVDINTTVIMVSIVTAVNTAVTSTTSQTLPLAAGYMSRGMKGSHGTQDKYRKYDPGRHAGIILFGRSVDVLIMMIMPMVVIRSSRCGWICWWGLFLIARRIPQIKYIKPKAINAQPARLPRKDSKASSRVIAIPNTIPTIPSSTELKTCPIPLRNVIIVVLPRDQFPDFDITMNGR